MAYPAVPLSLRERPPVEDMAVSLSGYRTSKVISDRIEHLKSLNLLNQASLANELCAIMELSTGVAVHFSFGSQAISAQVQAPEKAQVQRIKPVAPTPTQQSAQFCSEFLEFLTTGDYSVLANDLGVMSKETFTKTRDYIFCTIKKIQGRTAQAVFFSNSSKECGGILSPGLVAQPGPCVIHRKGTLILDYVALGSDYSELARSFNTLAARSKT